MRVSDWSSDVCSSDLRHFIGYEIVPEYCNIARQRIDQAKTNNQTIIEHNQ